MTIFLATDEQINDGQFFGLGTSNPGGGGFVRNTVVIPQSATITGMVFSIRDEALVAGDSISAEIFISTDCGVTPVPTGIIATVNGPNPPNCCAVATGNFPFPVNQCDLLSVRITIVDAPGSPINQALENGVAATILLTV
jgi:hypothetical protein